MRSTYTAFTELHSTPGVSPIHPYRAFVRVSTDLRQQRTGYRDVTRHQQKQYWYTLPVLV